MSRAEFESVISEFPYQADIRRFGDDSAWPGNYRDIGVDLAWHMWLAGRESMRDEAAEKKKLLWECNECGSQEYTMAVSEADVNQLGCGNCGACEWHKAEEKT